MYAKDQWYEDVIVTVLYRNVRIRKVFITNCGDVIIFCKLQYLEILTCNVWLSDDGVEIDDSE